MFSTKLLLTLFLFLTNALAARISYSCKYTGAKVGDAEKKASEVENDKVDSILENMSSWSSGKFTAAKSRATGIILVQAASPESSKAKASDAVKEMQHLVATKAKAKSKSPSPEPGRSGSKSPSHGKHRRAAAALEYLEEIFARDASDEFEELWTRSDDFDDIWVRSDDIEGLYDYYY